MTHRSSQLAGHMCGSRPDVMKEGIIEMWKASKRARVDITDPSQTKRERGTEPCRQSKRSSDEAQRRGRTWSSSDVDGCALKHA
jgi:hypothetical protein